MVESHGVEFQSIFALIISFLFGLFGLLAKTLCVRRRNTQGGAAGIFRYAESRQTSVGACRLFAVQRIGSGECYLVPFLYRS